LYYGSLDSRGEIMVGDTLDMEYCSSDNGSTPEDVYEFVTTLQYSTTGKRGISVRVLPNHDDLPSPFQTGLIAWRRHKLAH